MSELIIPGTSGAICPEGAAIPKKPINMLNDKVLEDEMVTYNEQTLDPQNTQEVTAKLSWGERGRAAVLVGLVAAEITPANEAIRLAVYGAGAAVSHNSALVGAATAGLSTLAVESVGAVAAAGLLTTDKSKHVIDWANQRLKKVGIAEDAKLSRYSKFSAAFLGGSVVAMTIKQREDTTRTKEQNRRFGLMTSAWLAGVMAVAGAGAAEGIDAGIENPTGAGLTIAATAGVYAFGRSRVNRWKIQRRTPEILKEWRKDTDKYGLSYGLLESPEWLAEAAIIEQAVWDEKEYGNLEEEGYLPFIKNSRTFGAFNTEGNIVGMNRMFQATETEVQPFLEMDFYDEKEKEAIITDARLGNTEELGTVAVIPKFRGKRVNLRLWRMAYRDARERGIQNWGIIMEPERVEKMNKHQGFTFRQLGPAVEYQGGDCAPFIMSLEEVDQSMSKNHRINYFWFVTKKLKP